MLSINNETLEVDNMPESFRGLLDPKPNKTTLTLTQNPTNTSPPPTTPPPPPPSLTSTTKSFRQNPASIIHALLNHHYGRVLQRNVVGLGAASHWGSLSIGLRLLWLPLEDVDGMGFPKPRNVSWPRDVVDMYINAGPIDWLVEGSGGCGLAGRRKRVLWGGWMDGWRNGRRDIRVLEVLGWIALRSGVGTSGNGGLGAPGVQVVAELHIHALLSSSWPDRSKNPPFHVD